MAWSLRTTQDNYQIGPVDIAPALTIPSGIVWLEIRRGWVSLGFSDVAADEGSPILTTNALVGIAPVAPMGSVNAALVNAQGVARRVQLNRNGQLRFFSLTAGEVLNGSLHWALRRPVPVSIPGVTL